MHNLEYLLLVLSKRIQNETGNVDLADAADRLAGTVAAANDPKRTFATIN
jgi:hypothetical protein